MKHLFLYPKRDYDKLYFMLKDFKFSESLISSLRHNQNAIKIENKYANMRSRVFAGEKVEISIEDTTSSNIPFNDIQLDILFEDDDLLILNKPAGIPTIPSKRHFENNLAGAVCKYMATKQPHFVFRALGRLDKDTSGIVVVAKNQYAATMTKIEKRYEAICTPPLSDYPAKFDICAPIETIIENGINQQKRQIGENGKPAKTHVTVIKNFADFSHISITLSQGRTHQIRVHLASINHPLIGDDVYGCKSKQSPLANRTLLHCAEAKITFLDESKPNFSLCAPIPNDFTTLLEHYSK